jgi:hypothetical protein
LENHAQSRDSLALGLKKNSDPVNSISENRRAAVLVFRQ